MSYENAFYNIARTIGQEAAIIRLNGQTDDYVKNYVNDELEKGGLTNMKFAARDGYKHVMQVYKSLNPSRDLLVLAFYPERNDPMTFTRDRSLVLLKQHLPQPVTRNVPFCRAMQY